MAGPGHSPASPHPTPKVAAPSSSGASTSPLLGTLHLFVKTGRRSRPLNMRLPIACFVAGEGRSAAVE